MRAVIQYKALQYGSMPTGCNKFNADLPDNLHSLLPERDVERNYKSSVARLIYTDLIQGVIIQKQVSGSYRMHCLSFFFFEISESI